VRGSGRVQPACETGDLADIRYGAANGWKAAIDDVLRRNGRRSRIEDKGEVQRGPITGFVDGNKMKRMGAVSQRAARKSRQLFWLQLDRPVLLQTWKQALVIRRRSLIECTFEASDAIQIRNLAGNSRIAGEHVRGACTGVIGKGCRYCGRPRVKDEGQIAAG